MIQLNNKKVDWKVFIWAIGIITLIIGWVILGLTGLNNKVEGYKDNNIELKVMMSEVRTNIKWIMETLGEIKNK